MLIKCTQSHHKLDRAIFSRMYFVENSDHILEAVK